MLRKHKKITKKELKQDPLMVFTAQAMDILNREWIKIVGTISAVFIVVVFAFIFVKTSDRSRVNAYDTAMSAYKNNQPEAVELLKKFADRYGKTTDGSSVLIQLGNYFLTKKDYDSAEKYYKASLDKFNTDPINAFNAYNGLGATYEAKGNFADAGKVYEQYINKFSDSVFLPNMYLLAGKAYYYAGNQESSLKYMNVIIDKYKDSQEVQDAVFFKEILISQASAATQK